MIPTSDALTAQSESPASDPRNEPDDSAPVPTVQRVHKVLDGLSAKPLHEHAEVYQGLHEELHAALSEIDGA